MESNAVAEALHREIYSAEEQARPLLHIRISPSAIQGSIVCVPVTPERARQTRIRTLEEGGVVADSEIVMRYLELIIHPHDWRTLLADPKLQMYSSIPGGASTYSGIKVIGD